jgi:hypothetical protein
MESIFTWSKRAKCRNEGVFQEHLTKKYCTDCPVKGLCNTYAIVHSEWGIWGGTNEKDRKDLSSIVTDLLKDQYQKAGLLENREVDVLGFQGQLGALQLVHDDPISVTGVYPGPTLSQSA